MVKLGSHVGGKSGRSHSGEGGDGTPLLAHLDVTQLEQPLLDKVIVKTTAEYQLQPQPVKRKKSGAPGIKRLNINVYDEVSEKIKLMGLILVTMAFLACLLLLVMYKALWYEQLVCPDGLVFKHQHCSPAALQTYYQPEQAPQGGLFAAITRLSQAKKAVPELLPSSWLPVITALKEAKRAKESFARVRQPESSQSPQNQHH